jgi:hypothetical protein
MCPRRPSLLATKASLSGALRALVECATGHFANMCTNSLYFRGRIGDRLNLLISLVTTIAA